ncbi:hypothetical protein [Sphingomonas sp.]|uniref:hypothetical protein n=1 Tax=Sphingomonas sp. TaxID=28214 RepID=UPI003CC5089C
MRAPAPMLAILAMSHAGVVSGTPTSTNPHCRVRVTQAQASAGPCGFDVGRRAFAGTPREQARCLLRHVGQGASFGSSDLTSYLAGVVGEATQPGLTQVARYLDVHHVDAAHELGGPLRGGLQAAYFVIHDTSSPNCSQPGACAVLGAFPANMDAAEWPDNRSFGGYLRDPASLKAHVITNRTGGSLTARDLAEHQSHTRFDYCFDAPAKRNLFVGVENIQPRIGSPARPAPGRPVNDAVAPVPGFTDAQYERLALIYIVASARHGRWLVPAYHAVLDPYYDPPSAHDDPQHFDLGVFSAKVESLAAAINRDGGS